MLIYELNSLKQDMKNYHRSKQVLNEYYIKHRLQASLKSYYKDLSQSVNYLNSKNPENVIKKM